MGYLKNTIKGVSWVGALRVFTRILSLVKTIVLARLLLPNQFGIYGIAALILAFLEILTDTGINVFLIQEEDDVEHYVNTAWVVSILRGTLICLLIVLFSTFVSSFFKTPESRNILLLISIVPLIKGFINPSIVKFQKYLLFKKEFIFRSFLTLIEAVLTITFAIITKSAVSLVIGLLISAVFEMALSFYIAKPIPSLRFKIENFKLVFNRGKWITLAGIFEYLYRNLDNITVGKILGVTSLGYYDMAYKISILPITEVSEVFSKVTFPIYTKIKEDKKRLKKAFMKVMLTTTVIVLPIVIILIIFTEPLVLLFLGKNWLPIINVLKVLSIFGAIRSISGISSALFLALKKQNYVTFVTFASILGLGISIVPLVIRYGILGAGISAVIGSILSLPVMLYGVNKLLK